MYMILSDAMGKLHECVLIAGNGDRMRIAFRGGEDAVELTRRQNQWISENFGLVEVEFVVAGNRPLSALKPAHQYLKAG